MNRKIFESAEVAFLLLGIMIWVLLFVVGGCAQPKQIVFEPQIRQITLQVPTTGNGLQRVDDRDDINQVIGFALYLSDEGRHHESAEIYAEAATRFDSTDGKLRQDLLCCAVAEAFQAGELEQVRAYFNKLEQHQEDVYDRHSMDSTIRKIREIAFGDPKHFSL